VNGFGLRDCVTSFQDFTFAPRPFVRGNVQVGFRRRNDARGMKIRKEEG